MIPGPIPSGSSTTAAPTRRSAIAAAASRSVCPGPTVRTTVLMPSLTCIVRTPSGSLATIGTKGTRPRGRMRQVRRSTRKAAREWLRAR